MFRNFILPFSLCASLFALAPDMLFSEPRADGEAAVQNVFVAYKTAILNDEGEKAVQHVTKKTLDMYVWMVDRALRAERPELERMSLLQRLAVLAVRLRTPLPKLKSFQGDGRATFVYAVEQGMVGKTGVSSSQSGPVKIDRDFAVMQARVRRGSVPMHFYREDGAWRLDLTHTMKLGGAALKQLLKARGVSEEEFLFSALEGESGRKIDASIYDPPAIGTSGASETGLPAPEELFAPE